MGKEDSDAANIAVVLSLSGTRLRSAGPVPSLRRAGAGVGERSRSSMPRASSTAPSRCKEVVDPFTGIDPETPPAHGTRYVRLTVTYEAALDQSLDAQPYQVVLQGADGTIFYPQYVPRPADSKVPDLQSQLMAPDNRLSGFIGFVVPADGGHRQGRPLALLGSPQRHR